MSTPAPEAPEVHPPLRVHIRRVADGVTRVDKCAIPFAGKTRAEAHEYAVFWWAEGNGCCDCNRELFFCQSEDEEDPDSPCTDGRYQIKVEDTETGDVLIDEFEP